MLDIKLIREQPDRVLKGIQNRNEEYALKRFDAIIALDKQRREIIRTVEEKKSAQNKISDEIGRQKRAGEIIDERLRAEVCGDVASDKGS